MKIGQGYWGAVALLGSVIACSTTGNAVICQHDEILVSGHCVARPERRATTRSIEVGPELRPSPQPSASSQPPPPPPAPSEFGRAPAASAGGGTGPDSTGVPSATSRLVPVRAFLRSAEIPPQAIGAYGVVAFRAKATPANRDRLLMVCQAFVAALPPQKSVPSTVSVGDQMLTIWPLDEPASPEADKDDCPFAIAHYDLYGGDAAIADAERQGAKLGADGPFLIGWSPSNSRGVPDKLVLVVDMSAYTSQDSFDHAFQFWKQKIVEDPSLWRTGFSIEAIRLAVRDFADTYGDTILAAAVSVWKK